VKKQELKVLLSGDDFNIAYSKLQLYPY